MRFSEEKSSPSASKAKQLAQHARGRAGYLCEVASAHVVMVPDMAPGTSGYASRAESLQQVPFAAIWYEQGTKLTSGSRPPRHSAAACLMPSETRGRSLQRLAGCVLQHASAERWRRNRRKQDIHMMNCDTDAFYYTCLIYIHAFDVLVLCH